MSFSSLPEELVALICFSITEEPEYGHDVNDYESLLVLCLVSRQTLHSAREELYQQPFFSLRLSDGKDAVVWRRAQNLLQSLRSNGDLGRLVRDTGYVQHWLRCVSTFQKSPNDNVKQAATHWYSNVLKCCTRLENVEIPYSKEEDLVAILNALFAYQPDSLQYPHYNSEVSSIRHIRFMQGFTTANGEHAQRLDYTASFDILRQSTLRSLDTLEVEYVYMTLPGGAAARQAQFPLPVRDLSIINGEEFLDVIIPFFPQDSSMLEDFFYEGALRKDINLLALSSLLGSNLRMLRVEFDSVVFTFSLASYYEPRPDRFLTITALECFPQLIHLSLDCSHGPSLRLLESLDKHSPLLSNLSFSSSLWISDSKNPFNDANEVFPEVRISAVLQKFTHLEEVDLGVLPTLDENRYEGFKQDLEAKGIAVQYSCCHTE